MTLAQLAGLHRSLRNERVLTVYIDGTAADPAVQRSWRTQLENALKDVRDWMSDSQRNEREAFQRCDATLDELLSQFRAGLTSPGWVAFITADGVAENHQLPVAVPTLAVWSTGPAIAPYMRALKEMRPVIAVVADATKSDIYRYQGGVIEKLDTIQTHHVIEPGYHMSAPPKQGFHTGTRGPSGRDAVQKVQLEGLSRMIQESADRVLKIAGDDAFVVVGGIKRVGKQLVSALGTSFRDRALQLKSLDVHATLPEIAAAAKTGASEIRAKLDKRRLDEIENEAGAGGLGALGPVATHLALESASVRELYLTHRYLEDHAADAEQVVRAALDQHAAVEEVSDSAAERLERAGGIAAGLRFRPAALAEITAP